MNSPWDPISVGSSRRSSMVEMTAANNSSSANGSPAAISQHISRLHRRAQQLKSTSSLASSSVQTAIDGRQSAMSDSQPNQQQFGDSAPRRASDPVRTLDRNFGVGGQMSRHRSYSQLGGQQQRMPVHQAMSGVSN